MFLHKRIYRNENYSWKLTPQFWRIIFQNFTFKRFSFDCKRRGKRASRVIGLRSFWTTVKRLAGKATNLNFGRHNAQDTRFHPGCRSIRRFIYIRLISQGSRWMISQVVFHITKRALLEVLQCVRVSSPRFYDSLPFRIGK